MDTNNCERPKSALGSISQRYERVRCELAIASLPLAYRDTTTKQLRLFVATALEMRDVCDHTNVAERPLDVLLWLRRRLKQEANNPAKGEFYRAQCLREVNKVERAIETSFVALSRGGLTILE